MRGRSIRELLAGWARSRQIACKRLVRCGTPVIRGPGLPRFDHVSPPSMLPCLLIEAKRTAMLRRGSRRF